GAVGRDGLCQARQRPAGGVAPLGRLRVHGAGERRCRQQQLALQRRQVARDAKRQGRRRRRPALPPDRLRRTVTGEMGLPPLAPSPAPVAFGSRRRTPFTTVPLDEPRSSISSPPSTGRTAAWRRDTSGSSTRTSTFSRPSTRSCCTSTRRPGSGPSVKTSDEGSGGGGTGD